MLIGYTLNSSVPLKTAAFKQKRINCLFKKGKLFYIEYNLRLFTFLLFQKMDCICAIDLDTIIPCWMISKLKSVKRVYDAHEYFTQLDEVVSRPFIHKCWLWVERCFIPRFSNGYTVCQSIADVFSEKYQVRYDIIRNVPVLQYEIPDSKKSQATGLAKNVILYQGAVNKGRGLNSLAEAVKDLNADLYFVGSGNYETELKEIVSKLAYADRIRFFGMMPPGELKIKTAEATVAVNPFERKGLNQYYSLSNKFFDYIHAGIPQVTMNYPEYQRINKEHEVAVLIDNTTPQLLSEAINRLLTDPLLYSRLKENCEKARKVYHWQNEETKLIEFYKNLVNE